MMRIANVEIQQNNNGLYSLNDLHKASGGEVRNRPGEWLRTDRAKRLIAELETNANIFAFAESARGAHGGTFGVKHVIVWLTH